MFFENLRKSFVLFNVQSSSVRLTKCQLKLIFLHAQTDNMATYLSFQIQDIQCRSYHFAKLLKQLRHKSKHNL